MLHFQRSLQTRKLLPQPGFRPNSTFTDGRIVSYVSVVLRLSLPSDKPTFALYTAAWASGVVELFYKEYLTSVLKLRPSI